MIDEELVEKAAKAISAKSWEGFEPNETFAEAYARIALAVFEEALGGAPQSPTDDEREALEGKPYVYSPHSLSSIIDGIVNDLSLEGDILLGEVGVREGAYFSDPSTLSESVQKATIKWLLGNGFRRTPQPEVEWEYRARATKGHVIGEARNHAGGAILAYEEALDTETFEQEDETHHLALANPRPLSDPIPYRGALGLRTLDDEMTARVLAAVEERKQSNG